MHSHKLGFDLHLTFWSERSEPTAADECDDCKRAANKLLSYLRERERDWSFSDLRHRSSQVNE